MGPAAKTFLEDAKDGLFTIDGTEPMLRHLGNCIGKSYRIGSEEFVVPVKASSDSPDKIDVAIAAIVAYARAKHHALHPPVKRLPFTAV